MDTSETKNAGGAERKTENERGGDEMINARYKSWNGEMIIEKHEVVVLLLKHDCTE